MRKRNSVPQPPPAGEGWLQPAGPAELGEPTPALRRQQHSQVRRGLPGIHGTADPAPRGLRGRGTDHWLAGHSSLQVFKAASFTSRAVRDEEDSEAGQKPCQPMADGGHSP